MYLVKKVSELTGVSVRTLHHYDQIGLLTPDSVTAAGYRLYTEENLERLQQILFFKEMDFSLQEIKQILERPDFDRQQALIQHKDLLLKKRKRLDEMIETVNRTLDSIKGGTNMSKQEMFDGFNMEEIESHQRKYREEAKEKYGEDVVEKTEKRTSQYSADQWKEIQQKTENIYKKIIERMEFGHEDPIVQDSVGEWRQFITDHFYDCSIDIFRGLGDLYVDDVRFTKNIDKYQEGLAAFLQKAMHHYCDTHSK